MKNTFNITLHIKNTLQPICISVRDDLNSVTPVNFSGENEYYDFVCPVLLFKINNKVKLAISTHHNNLSREEKLRYLLFISPSIAERKIPELYDQTGNWDFVFEYIPIPFDQDKEKIAGETYQQRSHLCYEDLLHYIVEKWQEPTDYSLRIDSETFFNRNGNRRIYESKEIYKAFTWVKGDGYLINVEWGAKFDNNNFFSRATNSAFGEINDAKIRELETKLSRNEIGVFPLVAGQVNSSTDFRFISDASLRDMVIRDCREINQSAKAGAAKSVILLCGSLIETILYDLLKIDEPKAQKEAIKLTGCPNLKWIADKLKNRQKYPLNKWEAIELILVANSLYPQKVSEDVKQYAMVLKDYRNLIHPGKEEREDFSLNQHTASIAISVVNLILEGMQ